MYRKCCTVLTYNLCVSYDRRNKQNINLKLTPTFISLQEVHSMTFFLFVLNLKGGKNTLISLNIYFLIEKVFALTTVPFRLTSRGKNLEIFQL